MGRSVMNSISWSLVGQGIKGADVDEAEGGKEADFRL